MDQMTMGMFDFDQRGSSADGLMRFLKGDKGETGDKGNRGALDLKETHQEDQI